jgi:predicted DNA-binding protein
MQRTKTFIIKQAISDKLEELEDYYLAVERLQKYDSRDNKSLKEIMEEYGLEG